MVCSQEVRCREGFPTVSSSECESHSDKRFVFSKIFRKRPAYSERQSAHLS